MSAVIRLEGVTTGYDGRAVLREVDLEVRAGEFLGVVGPNGGGKSTLLRLMLGLLPPWQGRVEVLGASPRRARRRVGYVPQYAAFPRDFPISVQDVVLTGRLGRTRPVLGYSRRDRRVAAQALEQVELGRLQRRPITQLSGGEFQRALVARALACEPEILMLDEPTANIDPRVETDLFELLRQLNERMTVLVVSHDLGFITKYVKRVACVNTRLVCHPTAGLDHDVIEGLYGHSVRMVDHGH